MVPHLEIIIKKMIESLRSTEGVKVKIKFFFLYATFISLISKFINHSISLQAHTVTSDILPLFNFDDDMEAEDDDLEEEVEG